MSLKSTVAATLEHLLGRKMFGRVSRYLWRKAQLDAYDSFRDNGERLLQRAVIQRGPKKRPLIVLDVGANLGQWSGELVENASELGPPEKLQLHMFEPSPESRDELLERFAADRIPDWMTAMVHAEGLDSEPGSGTLARPEPTAGTNSLSDHSLDEVGDHIEIELTSIDAFCERVGLDRIDLLKIDAEGNDLNVLKGAKGMLEAGRIDVVQFEYSRRWMDFAYFLRDALEFLEDVGYRVGKLTGRGLERHPEWHLELENFWLANYIGYKSLAELPIPSFPYWKNL